MIVINYHTPDYAHWAADLVRSLDRLGLPHHVETIDVPGGWQERCIYKAAFIGQCLTTMDTPLLWVDADAIVERAPDLLPIVDCDFAACWLEGTLDGVHLPRHLSAGSLFFNFMPAAIDLVSRWIDTCDKNPDGVNGDQMSLQKVVLEQKPRMVELPPEYAWIEPTPGVPDISHKLYGPRDPVIRHRQASRTVPR